MGVRPEADFSPGWVPPPRSSQLASCCFLRSSFSFSLTGSGTGMSNGAFRLLRLASLRAGSWCRVGEGLEAGASSHLLTLTAPEALPLASTPCPAPVPLKMHPTQKSSWENSSRAGSLSVCRVMVREDGVQNQIPFLGSEGRAPSKVGLSNRLGEGWGDDHAGPTLVHRSSRNTSTCGTQAALQISGFMASLLENP